MRKQKPAHRATSQAKNAPHLARSQPSMLAKPGRDTRPGPALANPAQPLLPDDLLYLQRTIGNQAVQRLLAERQAQKTTVVARTPAGEAIQRKHKRWKPAGGLGLQHAEREVLANTISNRVDAAHLRVVNMLKTGKLEQLPGVSDRRFAYWVETLQQGERQAASTGYIIEDAATYGLTDPPYELQVTTEMRNTRPDVVATDTQGRKAFLDITASASVDHIFDKEGNWAARDYVAEEYYPSINFGDIASTKLELSEEDMRKIDAARLEKAQAVWRRLQRHWAQKEQSFYTNQARLAKELSGIGKIKKTTSGAIKKPAHKHKAKVQQSPRRLEMRRVRFGEYFHVDDMTNFRPKSFEEWAATQNLMRTKEEVAARYAISADDLEDAD